MMGEIMSATPGSNDLINYRPIIKCEYRSAIVFINKTNFSNRNGEVHVNHIPIHLVWKGKHKVFQFDTPAIFHDKYSRVPTDLTFLKQYIYKTHDIEETINWLVNYASSISLQTYLIAKTLKGTDREIGDSSGGAGNIFERIANKYKTNARSGLKSLINRPIQIIVNGLGCVQIFSVIAYFSYLYIIRSNGQSANLPLSSNELGIATVKIN